MDIVRRVVVSLVVVGASGCAAGVDDDVFTSGPFTSPPANTTEPGVTTFEETTGSSGDADDVSTMGGSADDTADVTGSPTTTTTAPGTTTNSEECDPPCALDQMCVLGACVPMDDDSTTGPPACNDVPGNYEGCLGPGGAVDVSGCGDAAATCITVGTPPIAGSCSINPCVDACDCPGPPPTGNAVVTCDAITSGPDDFCYLDCSGGETCPTGMVCFADLACIWPGDGADGAPYGDCQNNENSICGLDGTCLGDMDMTIGVCTEDCGNVGDCWASPGGTAPVSCEDVTGDGMNECILDCSLGSCPAGMTCFSGFLCAWS